MIKQYKLVKILSRNMAEEIKMLDPTDTSDWVPLEAAQERTQSNHCSRKTSGKQWDIRFYFTWMARSLSKALGIYDNSDMEENFLLT